MATGFAISQDSRPPICCPDCGGEARLVDAKVLFPYNSERQEKGDWFWHCRPCRAWVRAAGKRGNRPLGTLANPMLRGLRDTVTRMVDALAELKARKSGDPHTMAKIAALKWLGEKIKIRAHPDDVDAWLTSYADVEECRAAIALMERYVRRPI